MTLSVTEVEDDARERWNAYVASKDEAALYHDYRWRDVIRRVFRRETYYFHASDSAGKLHGILPLARLKSAVFGDFLVSLPYFTYGGVLSDSADAQAKLLLAAESRARALGVEHIEFRHAADVWPEAPKREDKVAMTLVLPRDRDAFAKSLGAKLRSQIRRPIKEGATVTAGGPELIDAFYSVFARNMRDLGTPVYPKQFFAEIAHHLKDQCRIFVVSVKDEVTAAGVVLRHRDRVEIPWAASRRDMNGIGVNMLLYSSVLDWCIEQGATDFDFGRSTVNSGTYRFKAQWGAKPNPLYWHYWLPDGRELPQIRPDNPKYRLLVSLWRRQPIALANLIGPHIVKNLP